MVTYKHPRPSVAVDIVLFKKMDQGTQVLLIRRAQQPFQGRYALPGGFIDMDESLREAAARELREETGLEGLALRQIQAFGAPDRDPRGRVISIAFGAYLPRGREPDLQAGSDAADAGWYPVRDLPPLAFDHAVIIKEALQSLEG